MLLRFSPELLAASYQPRPGEIRLGDTIILPPADAPLSDVLNHAQQQGVRFVLLGIAEDIGPRANLGLAGAEQGWPAFVNKFLNLQHNHFINAQHILLLGQIDCTDLQQQSQTLSNRDPAQLQQLRQLCSELDARVEPVVSAILQAGLYPLVIGGGHNNSFPLLQALSKQLSQPVHCANLDPHADFRPLEGRHSGNGFSYAWQQHYLGRYFVLGLHELKNTAASLEQLQQAGARFSSYQSLFVRQEQQYQQALADCIDFVAEDDTAIAIEVDTDSISLMPASAFTNCGITLNQAEQFVYQLARLPHSRYLHLAEAAPAQHPAGLAAGINDCGQILSALVFAFIQGKQYNC